ncbi:hypothetical protein LTR40_009319 [Exophiala xenobiotica]|nr:hypothetical protein LTR40_009319 [Exophiala xenobiotica]
MTTGEIRNEEVDDCLDTSQQICHISQLFWQTLKLIMRSLTERSRGIALFAGGGHTKAKTRTIRV